MQFVWKLHYEAWTVQGFIVVWKQKFGFINQVDKGWITAVKDLESWRFEH